ncbi:hypothetical protein [Staphylococcus lutrae]|uniref:Uncharacterized protein n=1 Tax=Staphylococcus lutrae TaxID=155085 RepID=A0AAC9WIM4_9STAP|nr:hypothetical protein [Staphylococcus lutrae]ARJ50115.1 hypothetical protein B5P37_01505 [Staphylococcus lutrae]PNZ36790.1 hypothetical protein CD134_07450 [Staphylococcus lutrae]
MKLYDKWIMLMIISTIVNLIAIKTFPLALGSLYLPVLFKVVQLQLNLSRGLGENAEAHVHTFVKTNQKGVIISMICCMAITVALTNYLADFYRQLDGIWGVLIQFSPFTMSLGFILYVLTAIAVMQAVKQKFIVSASEEQPNIK